MSSPASAAPSRERRAESPASVDDAAQNAAKEEPADARNDDENENKKLEEGEIEAGAASPADTSGEAESPDEGAPPVPSEPVPAGPPLPNEPTPQSEDDGWDCQWDPNSQAWFFYNRITGLSQWENPRVPSAAGAAGAGAGAGADTTAQGGQPQPPAHEKPVAGGYNPAIHGDYDPNAWYAKGGDDDDEGQSAAGLADPSAIYSATAAFNRHTGLFQTGDMGPERHSDEAKSKRQMNAYFDVDAAANAHGGRSLKAERSNKKPTKTELKAFKEKRRARKEEKRRAWLRD